MTDFEKYWATTDRFIDRAANVLRDWDELSATIKGETP